MKEDCSKCEKPLEDHRVGKQRYCNACHAEWMRINRPKHSDLAPEAKMKANARAYANTYQKRGYIKKENCVKCGNPESEKHHEDYSKPTEVTWLCRPCHVDFHKLFKRSTRNTK